MITPAPCCRQNSTVNPVHAAAETLSQFAGSSRRSRIARSEGVAAGIDGMLSRPAAAGGKMVGADAQLALAGGG
jgi:hypothetical protein